MSLLGKMAHWGEVSFNIRLECRAILVSFFYSAEFCVVCENQTKKCFSRRPREVTYFNNFLFPIFKKLHKKIMKNKPKTRFKLRPREMTINCH